MPHTWSAQVIAMNDASITQMPYTLRNRGTGLCRPTTFCTRSLSVANGQTAHQNRPTSRKVIGTTGHHSTHISAVPALSWAVAGPEMSW